MLFWGLPRCGSRVIPFGELIDEIFFGVVAIRHSVLIPPTSVYRWRNCVGFAVFVAVRPDLLEPLDI